MKSKKRFAANLKHKPPNAPVFFIDRCLGRISVANALTQVGANVVLHDDYFDAKTSDEHWLKSVGERGWIVLSKDAAIRRKPNERATLLRANVIAFLLVSGNLTGDEMAALFLQAYPRFLKTMKGLQAPAIFTFGRDGRPKKL